jgi:hypothetical protein
MLIKIYKKKEEEKKRKKKSYILNQQFVCVGSAWKIFPVTARFLWSW